LRSAKHFLAKRFRSSAQGFEW